MPGEVRSVEHGAPLRVADGGALDPLVGPQCSLAVQLRRATGAVIGRSAELEAISQELQEASGHLAAVTLEGEPGIGKTRLLLAAAELASASGFTCVAITADEEIRGPFLVARSLFASSAIRDTAAGTPAEAAVSRVVEAISGRDERGFETLSPDAKLLRAFDLAGVAISTLAALRPLALLIDDVQWADDDTLRLLRYVVRSDADRPVFLFLTIRPDEFASVTEAVNFVADMERMGLVRRLRPGRFSTVETAELLKRVLGGPVEATSAAAMHVQSEGVPFIVEELARTHREAGTLQQVDGEWRLGRNAARLVPSAVRTLIDRRAARLPAGTRAALGDAAILGRSFSLRDLRAIRARVGVGELAGGGAAARAGRPKPKTVPTRSPTISGPRSGRASCSHRPRASRRTTRSPTSRSASSPRASSRRPGGGRSTPRSSTCCWMAAIRPPPACRCSPSTRSRPATRPGPRASRSTRRRRPRLERPRGGAPTRRAGAPGRLVAGRPAGPARNPRRRVRGPPPDRRAARRPDRAGRARRGDARSGRSSSTCSSGGPRRCG